MPLTRLPLTSSALTGTLPVASGGTGVTTSTALANTGNMVLLSTTTPTAVRDIDISIASGYDNYLIVGRGIDINTSANEIDLYFTSDNFSTTDSAVKVERRYNRLDTSGTGTNIFSGYCRLSENQGVDATDSMSFELTLFGATISSRSVGYSFVGHSLYGHTDDTHHYRYDWGGRSQTTSVIDGFRLRTNSGTTFVATGSVKLYGLR